MKGRMKGLKLGKRPMPKGVRHPHIGGTMGKKKGAPKITRAHTYTEK